MNAPLTITRLPPSSVDAEQSVIGGLLLDKSAWDRIGDLRPEQFFSDQHRQIFWMMQTLFSEGSPVDVITVAEALDAAGYPDERTGGLAYLGEIAANTPTAANIRRYAEIVVDKFLERQLMEAAAKVGDIAASYGLSVAEKIDQAQAAVMAIAESSTRKEPRLIGESMPAWAEALDKRMTGEVRGLPTGLVDLDRHLQGGLTAGSLTIIAGRPSMGKTSLALQIALHAAQNQTTALVLSMEMSERDVVDRAVSVVGRVSLEAVLAGDMTGENGDRIMAGVAQLQHLPLLIDDQGALTIFDVSAKSRAVKRRHGLGLLVIDYAQLMSGSGNTRTEEVAGISRALKALAKDLEIPVILLSQLSRKCDDRANRRPILSDLRESGGLEQDADVIIFVYRDEMYNPDSTDKGTAELCISKNRQGATGMVRTVFVGERTSFENLAFDWKPAEQYRPMKKTKRGFDD